MNIPKKYAALRVKQWMEGWNEVAYNDSRHRRKPDPFFYVLSMPASILKTLSGVERRTLTQRLDGKEDLNLQRKLDPERAKEIALFVENGYPWSDLSETKRRDESFSDLRMPGWLPTAIVINIKTVDDVRESGKVAQSDLVVVSEADHTGFELLMPQSFTSSDWQPTESLPIEVIDGQHRLWAFDSQSAIDFELPVVAFVGLDISWQAYLFYVINIKPKRINPSLAYDLYPLLRTEKWLNRIDGHTIYRDTRSQELTQLMWAHPDSPWHQRINMLGNVGEAQVKQASWVRNLTNAMVKRGTATGKAIGGLFGGEQGESVPWTRTEQGAFLMLAWQELSEQVELSDAKWAIDLRAASEFLSFDGDPAFSGKVTLLNTDQGVRGFHHVLNDMMMVKRGVLELDRFRSTTPYGEPTIEDTRQVILAFKSDTKIYGYLKKLCSKLASFDWRTSDAFGLTEEERTIRKTFRGSGGYKEMRVRLLRHLMKDNDEIGQAAEVVYEKMGYEESE